MSYHFGIQEIRPNRLESRKNKDYHLKYGRHCLGILGNHTYRKYIDKCLINWEFFKGGDGQWIFEEDIESFFLDESGDIRNRLKWTKNVIKPMVQQYVGNAIRLGYNAKADCISDFVINKRERELKKLRDFHKMADKFPFFGGVLKEKMNLQDTPLETEELYNNIFVEEYEQDINNLLQFISEDVNLDELKVQLARFMAICGMGIYKGYEQSEQYLAEAINPLFFFWDLSAKKPDLSDSEYMGEWYYMDAPSILERWGSINSEERKAIENYGSDGSRNQIHRIINGIYTHAGGKIPVYEVYWKDIEKREYGWVNDEFGYPFYTMINHDDSPYTDSDLIEPMTDKHKESMGKKKKHVVFGDILRYCVFIPKEEIGTNNGDIVLEYGILPYQEKKIGDPANVKFPYKCYTWVYDRGQVLTPLDDVIDPQRFLNRTISIIESHMSNMRGTGTVISKGAVDDRDGEAEVSRNINSSKPIFVDTDRVGSVQNAIGEYGTNLGNGTLQMFEVINQVQNAIQDVTGVNEAMTGTMGGSDSLVGVVNAQIQRGSLVQEPFYWGLTSILKQAFEHMSTVGRAIYHDNPRKLAIMVGDKGLANITITKEHLLQDYRIFIDRAETRSEAKELANQLLFTFLQAGLIDDVLFSELYNRATPELVATALRRHKRSKLQAQNMSDKAMIQGQSQAAEQEAALGQAMQAQVDGQRMAKAEDDEMSHQRKMDEIAFKEEAKLARESMRK